MTAAIALPPQTTLYREFGRDKHLPPLTVPLCNKIGCRASNA